MKNILLLLLLLIAIPSQAEIVSRNLVGTAADIHLTESYQEEIGTGDIRVQLCPSCPRYDLTITPQTRVLKRDKPLTLIQLKTHLDANRRAPMRLQFHKSTKQVFSINLQPKNKEYPQ